MIRSSTIKYHTSITRMMMMNSEVSHDATNLHPQNGVICRGHQIKMGVGTIRCAKTDQVTTYNVGGNDS